MSKNKNLELTPGKVKEAMQLANASSSDLWKVAPDNIKLIPEFNARIVDAEYIRQVRTLANSMKVEGFYPDKPLTGYVGVTKGGQIIYLTDGHRRLEAAKLAISEGAEIEKLPIIVAAKGTSVIDLTVALVKGNAGQPLKPYEVAVVCKRLARFGWDDAKIAERLDFTQGYVADLLLLMASPEPIHEAVRSGTMSMTTAVELCVEHGAGVVEYLDQCKKAAADAGKTKITKAMLPGEALKRYAKKNANMAFGALKLIQADPAYIALNSDLRLKLDALLANAEKAGKK